jgi:hypothetical protein
LGGGKLAKVQDNQNLHPGPATHMANDLCVAGLGLIFFFFFSFVGERKSSNLINYSMLNPYSTYYTILNSNLLQLQNKIK